MKFSKRSNALSSYLQSIGQGSGLFGSITSKDLAKASVASAQTTIDAPARVAPAGSFSDLPTTGVRNVIAKRLLESKQVNTSAKIFP